MDWGKITNRRERKRKRERERERNWLIYFRCRPSLPPPPFVLDAVTLFAWPQPQDGAGGASHLRRHEIVFTYVMEKLTAPGASWSPQGWPGTFIPTLTSPSPPLSSPSLTLFYHPLPCGILGSSVSHTPLLQPASVHVNFSLIMYCSYFAASYYFCCLPLCGSSFPLLSVNANLVLYYIVIISLWLINYSVSSSSRPLSPSSSYHTPSSPAGVALLWPWRRFFPASRHSARVSSLVTTVTTMGPVIIPFVIMLNDLLFFRVSDDHRITTVWCFFPP